MAFAESRTIFRQSVKYAIVSAVGHIVVFLFLAGLCLLGFLFSRSL